MTSYEIANLILELRSQTEEGLIDEQTFNDTVEAIGADEKLNGLIYAVKRLDAEAEMLKAEKQRIDRELKKQEKNKETLKGFINLIMSATQQKKFEGVAGKLSYRKSKSIEYTPEFVQANLSADYIKEDITYKVDKKALKALVESTGPIEGVTIKESNNLQIK